MQHGQQQQQQPAAQHQPPMPMVAPYQQEPPPPPPPEAELPAVRRLGARHILFKVAFAVLFLSMVVFIVGMACPAWQNRTGLWLTCDAVPFCRTTFYDRVPVHLHVARVLEILALLALFASAGLALYQDVLKAPPPPDNKAVEILAGLAGTLGLAGVTVFGGYNRNRYEVTLLYDQIGFYHHRYRKLYLNWAFALTAASSISVLACALLLAGSRILHAARTSAALAARGVYIVPARVVYQSPRRHQTAPLATHAFSSPTHLQQTDQQQASSSSAMDYYQQQQQQQGGAYPGDHHQHQPGGGAYPNLPSYAASCYPESGGFSPSVASAPPAAAATAGVDGATPLTTQCSPSKQGTSVTTSSVPVCYVVNQGQTIPVFNEVPTVVVTAAP